MRAPTAATKKMTFGYLSLLHFIYFRFFIIISLSFMLFISRSNARYVKSFCEFGRSKKKINGMKRKIVFAPKCQPTKQTIARPHSEYEYEYELFNIYRVMKFDFDLIDWFSNLVGVVFFTIKLSSSTSAASQIDGHRKKMSKHFWRLLFLEYARHTFLRYLFSRTLSGFL